MLANVSTVSRAEALEAIRLPAFKAAIELCPTIPPPVLAMMMILFEDQGSPVQLDPHGCKITDSCSSIDPADAATVDRWFRERFEPNRLCDECGLPLHGGVPEEDRHELEFGSVSADCFKFFFLCESCLENWQAFDDPGLPNVCRKLST